ncbi:phage Gp37/Gp68 family protein [Hyphomonas sp.]|uniref:phage Gp37/Gp68 family protein n=1 Tax=Hyphomonas sp. TaxID=87 RepID=UPI0025BD671D|nr:phage Gp37/Gp68 family protein [Hyphomonas sp.]
MADGSKIEWTDDTWNPFVGCSLESPGCTNCYAMKQAPRTDALTLGAQLAGKLADRLTVPSKNGPVWSGQIRFAERKLSFPLQKRHGRRIFVNSMSDLFHEDVPDEWIDKVFAVMALCPQHTFQILTKRAARMRAYIASRNAERPWQDGNLISMTFWNGKGSAYKSSISKQTPPWPLPNVWLGVSVEDQKRADERIPVLLDTPAAVRWISAEPLLRPVSLEKLCLVTKKPGSARAGIHLDALEGRFFESGLPYNNGARLDWIVCGGESGRSARPMHPDWARSLRDQCAAAGTPFFFKQWGEWAPGECADSAPTRTQDAASYYDENWTSPGWHFERITPRASEEMHREDEPDVYRLGKKAAGRLLDGVEHNALPEVRT